MWVTPLLSITIVTAAAVYAVRVEWGWGIVGSVLAGVGGAFYACLLLLAFNKLEWWISPLNPKSRLGRRAAAETKSQQSSS